MLAKVSQGPRQSDEAEAAITGSAQYRSHVSWRLESNLAKALLAFPEREARVNATGRGAGESDECWSPDRGAGTGLCLALGDKAEARKGVDRVLAAGKVPEVLLQDAAMKLEQKDYAGARGSRSKKRLGKTPEDVRARCLCWCKAATRRRSRRRKRFSFMREYARKPAQIARCSGVSRPGSSCCQRRQGRGAQCL